MRMGRVMCWIVHCSVPAELAYAVAVSCGTYFTAAIDNGRVICWGINYSRQSRRYHCSRTAMSAVFLRLKSGHKPLPNFNNICHEHTQSTCIAGHDHIAALTM
jgi:alpha-tubulin suppressor-like RCC1 family protein